MTNTAIPQPPITDRGDEYRDERRIDPRTGRTAGAAQGALLLAGSCLPVLGAVLLAPVLPSMSREFAGTPGAEVLVPLVLTVPALFIALLAPFAGAIVDKLGRKRVLIIALFLYALVGTAPLLLDSLVGILVSRMLVGITEAFIITCCTTLIADYFSGAKRDRYLGLQATVTAIAATAFFAIGGALGASGWRTPFGLYAISVVVALLMIVVIWPTRQTDDGGERAVAKLPPVDWRRLAVPAITTIFGGIVFYTIIVELPYVLAGMGVTETAAIGGIAAISSLATAIGAFSFRWTARLGTAVLLPVALGLSGLGLVVVAVAPDVPLVVLGAVITGFGDGVLLPTLITWAISRLTYDQRGRGSGTFAASIFFGQFLCPIIVVALTAATGSLGAAIAVLGVLSLVLAAVVLIAFRVRRSSRALAA